jgi:hypothetical protein
MPDIEPFEALALSLHHNPGVYALLVGSGLSRAAGIPTGWEITLDLIERLAAVKGIKGQPNWETWFRNQYKKAPSYSDVLDASGASPAERRSILHGYIEPREDDAARRPTKAHRSIAKLVSAGAVRVIITTNFDRLLENALRDVGVEPTVIASDDAVVGATPLVHSKCTVIKLHGDYLDARIKNTDAELGSYAGPIDKLLDEIFDQFGLIAYADASTHIDVQEDLATALSSFQALHAQARTFVEALLQAAKSGRAATLLRDIEEELTGVVQELHVEAVADSRESFSSGQVKLNLLYAQLMARDGATSFTVVRTGANRIVFTVLAMLTVSASATFTFHGWEDDQGPYDYEESDEELEDWFETDLLFDLDTSGIFPRITNVELLGPPEEIDFGTIESMAASDARYG